MKNTEKLLFRQSNLRVSPSAKHEHMVDIHKPLKSSFHLIKLIFLIVIGAFVGASIMCNGGISIGSLSKALINNEFNAFVMELLQGNSATVIGWGALLGACCGGSLYLLACTAPQAAPTRPADQHGKGRHGPDMRAAD